jgi:hypothetical protein
VGFALRRVRGTGDHQHVMDLDQLRPSNQRALQAIAREIIERAVGERLDTTLSYQKRLDVGAGTIQKALRLLQSVGAARLKSSGHQGTFIEAKHIGLLWSLSGLDPIRISMTPPGAIEHETLATSLRTQFDSAEIPVTQQFDRGAGSRLSMALAGESDVAILSRGAAEALCSPEEWSLHDIGGHSYYSEHSLLVVRRAGATPTDRADLRIGIDHASQDHVRLTAAEFDDAPNSTMVECSFPHIPRAILEGRLDTGIWHRMTLLIPLELCGLEATLLSTPAAVEVADQVSAAVLAVPRNRPWVAAVIDEMDMDAVRKSMERMLAPDSTLRRQHEGADRG